MSRCDCCVLLVDVDKMCCEEGWVYYAMTKCVQCAVSEFSVSVCSVL